MLIGSNNSCYPMAIIGAGCAGLSLAYKLINSQYYPIVLIDPQNDRKDHIWGFWDDGNEDFKTARSLEYKRWSKWAIKTENKTITLKGNKFQYSALSSLKFESHLRDSIQKNNGKFLTTSVLNSIKKNNKTILKLKDEDDIQVERVFDSRSPLISNGAFYQHFLGWNIKSKHPIFDDKTVILMDFRVSQDNGIHFIYLLPFSTKEALIESTVYSNNILPTKWYENAILKYIKKYYPGIELDIISKEKGAIPLTNTYKSKPLGVPIGLNANSRRISSGYAFAQIQTQISLLSKSLELSNYNIQSGASHFEQWMDKIFINVLIKHPDRASKIFLNIFENLNGDEFANFMNGYCSIKIKAKVMGSLPKNIFIKSALYGFVK